LVSTRATNQHWGVLQHPYVSLSQNPATALNKHHVHYILQRKGPLHERKFLTSNDLERGVANLCALSPKTGTLLLWEIYQIDGKGAQRDGEYVESATVWFLASYQLELSVNQLWTTFVWLCICWLIIKYKLTYVFNETVWEHVDLLFLVVQNGVQF